jgi:hypothetical protein
MELCRERRRFPHMYGHNAPLCTVCGDLAVGTLENIDGSKFRYCADHVADSNEPLLSPLLTMLRDWRPSSTEIAAL